MWPLLHITVANLSQWFLKIIQYPSTAGPGSITVATICRLFSDELFCQVANTSGKFATGQPVVAEIDRKIGKPLLNIVH
jgi:hypothetical protein